MSVVRERLKELFKETLRLSRAGREEYIANLGDDEVAEELRSLLAAHNGHGPFDELLEHVSEPHVDRLFHLEPGDSLGPYRIVREIASGGMAIVYEAEDLKHEREVAIKVLRPELAALLGADRFIREMKTTARLQHPHILPLFDSGEAEGLLYYVMPYVEGETLRDRLNREKQLGVQEAVQITTRVAAALDYAHGHDVIHRDIKPGNILLQEGGPLVSDFGIALAVSTAAGERTTEAGVPLGTPHYMSPEQAAAEKHLTQRSDIYSLGCVLYEMLAGEPPHTGTSAGQIIRSIVTEEAQPVSELRKTVPPNVAAALAKSLEKLPADRFESVGAFAQALADPSYTKTTAPPRPLERGHRLAVGLIAVAVVAILAVMWGWLRPVARQVDRRVVEFTLEPPESALFGPQLVLSPDGRRLVAEVCTKGGCILYQRTLDSPDWRILPGTEGASGPFFSPDGEWLGFTSTRDNTIKRMPAAGGSVQAIIPVRSEQFGGQASWGPDDNIVFSDATGAGTWGLFRVPVEGGVAQQLTIPDRELGEWGHGYARHLQSGDVVLFNINSADGVLLAALSLESGRLARLRPGLRSHDLGDGRVAYATTGGYVVAQTFDLRMMSLRGSPRQIAEGIDITAGFLASYTISGDGSLAYLSRPGLGNQLLLVSREGEVRPLLSVSGESKLMLPRYSPSGDRIAFVRSAVDEIRGNIWVYSLRDSMARQLTFGGLSTDPAWTNDGRSIGYSATGRGSGSSDLFLRAADGTGAAERILVNEASLYQIDFAPGDSEVVFFKPNTIFRVSLVSDSGPVPLIDTGSYATDPALSPDGRWLAYKSNETGVYEVYVRSYPDMGPATVVSVGGGGNPAWSADGSEIFYRSGGRLGRLMAASVRYEGPRVKVDRRDELIDLAPYRPNWNRNYAVHPNGRDFVLVGDVDTRIVWRVNALVGEE